ncbi:hypothetical protein B0H14DRAFT_3066631 [Mycena olivaceomarginata]|nr:hypothetical protein B0H14DRAFT_3066631 [Mycena olivaceomarginata]
MPCAYFAGADPTAVLSAEHELVSPQIDRKTLKLIPALPIMNAVIQCEKGEIKVMNYIMPTLYHSITVTTTANKKSRVEKAYTFPDLGEPWWTTYRYQLEAFVNKVKGRTPHAWAIESVYAKSELGSRPKSEYVPN